MYLYSIRDLKKFDTKITWQHTLETLATFRNERSGVGGLGCILKTGKFITGAWLTVSSHVSTRYTTTNRRRSKYRLRYTTMNRRRSKNRLRDTTTDRRRSKNRLRDTRRRRAITTKNRRNRRTRVPYTYLTSW